MNENKFYTIQIYMHDYRDEKGELKEPPPIELKDVSWNGVKEFQEKIWVRGFRLELVSGGVSYELVDPLRIKRVLALLQDRKYSI